MRVLWLWFECDCHYDCTVIAIVIVRVVRLWCVWGLFDVAVIVIVIVIASVFMFWFWVESACGCDCEYVVIVIVIRLWLLDYDWCDGDCDWYVSAMWLIVMSLLWECGRGCARGGDCDGDVFVWYCDCIGSVIVIVIWMRLWCDCDLSVGRLRFECSLFDCESRVWLCCVGYVYVWG